ncbi:DNA cytosine methyltransferase [Leifsonia xyli]|uniref:DNA cytosine methyltransferase n=1 Tax=Leifsonia xyli TaxID=1575 RepID=UPI0009D6BF6A
MTTVSTLSAETVVPLRSVDLFSGAGGLAYGLTSRGFDVCLGSDVWKPAAETYRANFPGHTFAEVDVRDLSSADLIAASGGAQPDLVAGGPPCQGFSSAGSRSMDDECNTLDGIHGWPLRFARPLSSLIMSKDSSQLRKANT